MKKILAILLSVFFLLCLGTVSPMASEEPADASPSTSDEADVSEAYVMPRVEITTAQGNGPELKKSDGYVSASVVITDTDGTELAGDAQLKVRGNSTALDSITKKAFTVKFDKKTDVLGMGKAKKWSLLANAFDPTMMRNYIALDFARTMGLEFTSSQQYVELWLDNSYRGCYVLTEPVEAGSTRVDIDIESNDGMKDFLIEKEFNRYEEDVTYFVTQGIRFAVSEPEEPDNAQLQYIQTVMDDIMQTIKTGNQQEISAKIDIPSFTRYYLLNEMLKTVDFDYSSVFYYYKDGVLYCGPAWDYDLSSGNANPAYSATAKAAYETDGIFAAGCHLYKDLCSYEWFQKEIRSTYIEYYDYISSIYSKDGVIDTLLASYSDVFDRNFSDTPWAPSTIWVNLQGRPLPTFSENVEFLREWYASRNNWLSDYYGLDKTEILMGDADASSLVSVKDATAIQKHIASVAELTAYGRICSEVDKDGVISVKDATLIQKFLADLVPQL